jgi:hypothetical protein
LIRSPRRLLAVSTGDAHGSFSFDDELTITDDGRRVLAGDADRVSLCGIDRWLGGVHVTGTGPVWRWDARRQVVRVA